MSSTANSYAPDIQSLYMDHHGWLQGWLRRKLGCYASAADLAQDTFVRLLAKQEPIQIRDSRAVLVTVARSVLSNHFRRQKLERAYLEALAAVPEQLMPSLEEQAILLQTLQELDRLMDGLEVPVRQAFLWFQLDGMRHSEIAEQLGVSVTTVKRYIIKAGLQCCFSE
ncbi:RNA polymerase subunit sigma [Pseudomonas aeruginosa]|jgi:RNA polymerase sigma-70 factor (ECF subfamily)|uniref:sigma-70 family RNA polymerase sigma factor n=1 Tax=Pseudomonas aeruginosa TaxID=287 RepID=UPI00053D91AD|nr:sigma-70 family RNA polymerase sigma factor [Pseudomonas aeruginosa]ALZ10884.1 RNA polymerase sigma factor [Pseudomonas aeruginosa]KSL00347.1 RNA polymerase subunit sigma [Pseudomonas aeruginosa]MBF1859773.1 sigma-70 family RNA polymerase sigma factor [Pseudomonas aeruginosa]MBI8646347.1 sigma-70 family RNA polymerase sigma factor [Pseudomonas aeruginosa]MBV6000790.1 sigma-70 family RNA polymerase sigma factor [Pseudomonas aeruginosa]